MLVDHHCHIDRPEFKDDLDGVVARAHAAGVGMMVNISTRIRRFAEVQAVIERYRYTSMARSARIRIRRRGTRYSSL